MSTVTDPVVTWSPKFLAVETLPLIRLPTVETLQRWTPPFPELSQLATPLVTSWERLKP